MLRALPRYRPDAAPFAAWLFAIAARRVADVHRQRQRQVAATDPDGAAPPGDTVEAAIERRAELATLQAALAGLRPTDRQVIDLHFFAGLSHAEAAPLLGCRREHVPVRLYRALQRLATAYHRTGGESEP